MFYIQIPLGVNIYIVHVSVYDRPKYCIRANVLNIMLLHFNINILYKIRKNNLPTRN